jgi:hypothetical protein
MSIGEGAEPLLAKSEGSATMERLREAMISSAMEPLRELLRSSVVEPRREGGPDLGEIMSSSTTEPLRIGAACPLPAKRTAAVKAVETRVGVCILSNYLEESSRV